MATGIPKAPRMGSLRALGSEVKLDYPGKIPEETIIRGSKPEMLQVGELFISPQPECDFFFGDNLGILRFLSRQYCGRVNLVYIDPPFASSGNYSTRTLDHAYEDVLHGAHYIEFLRKRLVLLKELLADSGSIYVHLDENMAFTIKMIMDEVFGSRNFRNFIVRKKCNPKNFTRRSFGNICDYILFYTKSDDYVFQRQFEPWSDEGSKREYQYVDGDGRRYKKVPVHAPGTRNGATGQPWRGKLPPPGKHWQYPPDVLDEMDQRGEIYWSPTGNPRRKIYLDESKGIPIQDVWLDCKDPHNQNIKITGYPTEKNQTLLERIVLASSQPGDLVLDAFAGSGTTMTAALMHGRNCIAIDNSPVALNAVLSRFLNGLSRMGDFVNPAIDQSEQEITVGNLKVYSVKESYGEAVSIFEGINVRKVA